MRAINAGVMRQVNRGLILNHIRLRPTSRAELAEKTLLTRAAVSQIVDELLDEGLITQKSVPGETRMGRRSALLTLSSGTCAFFGIHLDHTQMSVGAIDLTGETLAESAEIIVGRAPEDVLNAAESIILRQQQEIGCPKERIFGIGLCAPGNVSTQSGCLIDPAGMTEWRSYPAGRMLSQRMDVPVTLAGSAQAQALDEIYFGRNHDRFMLVSLDQPIMASMVVEGKVCTPIAERSVELGRLPGAPDAPQDRLGDHLNGEAVLEKSGCRTWREFIDKANSGGKDHILREAIMYLSFGIASLLCAFPVDEVILTGFMTERGEDWLPVLEDAVRRRVGRGVTMRIVRIDNSVRIAAASAYDRFFAM